MGYMFLSISINVVAYWVLILIMQCVCSAHLNLNGKSIIICTIMAVTGNFILHITDSSYVYFATYTLISLTILMFSSKMLCDILLSFPAITVYFVLTVIPENILAELFPRLNTNFTLDGHIVRIPILAINVTLLVVLLLLRYVLLKYEITIRLSTKEIVGFIGLLFFSLIDVALLMSVNISDMQPFFYYIWKIIFVGAFIFSIAYYLFALIESRVRIYRQTLSRSEMEYLRVQLDSLQDVKENEEQVRHLRHDLNNHLTVIQSLCEDGDYEEIRNYTERLRNDIVLTASNVLTGNKVADLVVRSKLKVATEHDIVFTFTGSLEHLTTMDAPDICGLLANAYDNAIEACLPQEKPYIHTKVSSTRNYTVIKITNSIIQKIPIRGNHIATTKNDKHSHGYGIDIMKRIAHKYNGSCTLYSNDTELTVKIVLLNGSSY